MSDAKFGDIKKTGAYKSLLLVVWGLSPALLLIVAALGFGTAQDAMIHAAAANMVLLVALTTEIAWAMFVVRPIELPWAMRILAVLPITLAITYVNAFLALAGWCAWQCLMRLMD